MRFLCTAIALLLVGAAPSPVPGGNAPADPVLLTRIATASGEPWRLHVVSRIVTSTDGHLVENRTEAQGDRILTRRCSGNVCVGVYNDGTRTSAFSYNETPIPQPQPVTPLALALRAVASYEFASESFRATGGRTLDDGTRQLDGATLRAVGVEVPGAQHLTALVDNGTALVRAIAAADGTILVKYADQRRVGGAMLPFTIERGDGSIDRFDSRDVEPEPLAPPSGPRVTFAADSKPVTLEPGGALPRFPCRIETIATTCLLDTGASGLAIGLGLADRLHKTPVGQIALRGLGAVLTGVIRADSLTVGAMQLGTALYAVIPDDEGVRADVVIGADVIARTIVRLNMAKHTIAFEPLGTPLLGSPIALLFDDFTPTLALALGTLPVRLAVDTGDEASIDLPIAFYRAHPGLFTASQRRAVVGVGGRGEQQIGQIGEVRIGDFTFTAVPIGATEATFPTRPRLGAAFLTRLAVELDYASARMGLSKP